MGFIHNPRRNRLSAERASDLTYCYYNLRLRDSLELGYDKAVVEWEEDGLARVAKKRKTGDGSGASSMVTGAGSGVSECGSDSDDDGDDD